MCSLIRLKPLALLVKNVSRKSVLHTDESRIYTETGKEFAGHATVIHSKNEYVRGTVHTTRLKTYGLFSSVA